MMARDIKTAGFYWLKRGQDTGAEWICEAFGTNRCNIIMTRRGDASWAQYPRGVGGGRMMDLVNMHTEVEVLARAETLDELIARNFSDFL